MKVTCTQCDKELKIVHEDEDGDVEVERCACQDSDIKEEAFDEGVAATEDKSYEVIKEIQEREKATYYVCSVCGKMLRPPNRLGDEVRMPQCEYCISKAHCT